MADDGEDEGSGVSGSAVTGAIGGAASAIPALFGRGQNKRLAPGFVGQPGYDPSASQYGGSARGLGDYTSTLQNQAQWAQGRTANLADYGQANQDAAQQQQARQGQVQLANAQMARALGQTPSIAQQQGNLQMQQAQAAQGAQQASARGAAGLALGGQVAAGNTANAQGSIANQTQINSANERMAAEGAAQNAFGAIRGGDANAQGLDAQQAQFQAGQQQANVAQNDATALGYQQQVGQANIAGLQAGVQNQGTLAGAYNAANVANQQTGNQNAGSKGIIQTIGDFFSSDERSKVPVLIDGLSPSGGGPMDDGGLVAGTAKPAYALSSGGALDVNATGKQQGLASTGYGSHPGPMMLSDGRSKSGIDPRGSASPPTFAPNLGKYDTPLSDGEEQQFQAWKAKYAPRDTGGDYDLRGAFKAGLTPDPKTGHWVDTFKKPNHPTFSVESQYADAVPAKAGSWNGEKYIPPNQTGMSRGGSGPRGEGVGNPDAPRATFDPLHGWTLPGAPTNDPNLTARQEQQDAEDADIMRQVARQQGLDARNAKDPAVGLDRIARDRKMIRGSSAPADENAQTDADKGLAPGTTDFEGSKPKAQTDGPQPWWASLGSVGAGLSQAQFGDGSRKSMLSDERTKFVSAKGSATAASPWASEKVTQPAQPKTKAQEILAVVGGRPEIAQRAAEYARSLELNNAHGEATGTMTSDERAKTSAPVDSAMSGANRAMAGSAYAYKPGMTPPEQRPGEPNFGPMAQNMERNPITATAVKTDPATGLKVIDKDKALKVTMAGLADLQAQNDMIKARLAMGGR